MKFITVILVVLFVMLQYRLWTGNSNIPELRKLEQIKTAQTEENKHLRERNRALTAEVYDLKHGLEAIEERARSEMGMIKSDETFFQVVTKQKSPSDSLTDP